MSHFSKEDRDKARQKGGAEDFVKVPDGEAMQFRLTKIGRVRMAEDAPNGPFECFPFEAKVEWHRDTRGNKSVPAGWRWEPAAEKVEGLIEIADRLEGITGSPDTIFERDILLEVTSAKSKNGRTFFTYTFSLVGPWPVAGAAQARTAGPGPGAVTPATRPATAGPGPVAGPGSAEVTPAQYAATLRHAFGQCGDLATLEQEARRRWPDAQKAKATVEAATVFKVAKIECVGRLFNAATDVFELGGVWQAVSGKFENDPAGIEAITAAYRQREAAINASADVAMFPGDAPADEAPPPWA